MCNGKMCNWLKSLFGKKDKCSETSCCGGHKSEEKAEDVIAPIIEATEVK